jgi:allantoate deiminase
MREGALRAIAECQYLATLTEEPGRITRRFLTVPTQAVHAHLRGRMESLGMNPYTDAAGNLRGVWRAGTKRLIVGSHIDTVPDGGAYDGVLGVMLALELIEIARELDLRVGLEVIAFSEEEGVRFQSPFLGSRAVAGRFDPALLALTDPDGITLEAAIRRYGLDPQGILDAAITEETLGFLEIHIEQGPVLEAEDLSVASVSGIVGQSRLSLEFSGQANHAGTTPMHLRRDALAGAAEWITAVEALTQNGSGLVATVGRIENLPNANNVISGAARVSLDVRHALDAERRMAVEEILHNANRIAQRRKLLLQYSAQLDQPAIAMDERLTAFLDHAITAAGLPQKQMYSGAGHDAMVMASRMPTAMLFLRSPGGISHNPAETVREEDVEAALTVAQKFLERLTGEVR